MKTFSTFIIYPKLSDNIKIQKLPEIIFSIRIFLECPKKLGISEKNSTFIYATWIFQNWPKIYQNEDFEKYNFFGYKWDFSTFIICYKLLGNMKFPTSPQILNILEKLSKITILGGIIENQSYFFPSYPNLLHNLESPSMWMFHIGARLTPLNFFSFFSFLWT